MIDADLNDRRVRTSIQNRTEELERLHQTALAFARREGLTPAACDAIDLVLEEVVSNVIDNGDARTIDVELSMRAGEVVVCVADDGRPFNPVSASEPDVDEPGRAAASDEVGLAVVRQLAHTLNYRRQNGRNVLRVHLGVPVR